MRMTTRFLPGILLGAWLLFPGAALANEVEIVRAAFRQSTPGTWSVQVTLVHEDAGWEHYADAWEVVAPDGTVLGTRELLHPHEREQPFTRSLSGVQVPKGVAAVTIRARDKVHGFGGKEMRVELAE